MFTTAVSEKLLLYVCGFGILQGVLLAGLLYFHPGSNRRINLFLSLYVFSTPLIMGLPFFLRLIGWQHSFFVQPVALLPGPFLYLYLRSFKEHISWQKALPHFIPFFVFLFFSYLNLSAWSNKYPQAKQIPPALLHDPASIALQYMKPVQQVIYYILARLLLKTYRKKDLHLFQKGKMDIHWVAYLVNGYMVLVAAFIVIFPLMLAWPAYFNLLLLANMALATPYVYLAAYKGFIQLTTLEQQSIKIESHLIIHGRQPEPVPAVIALIKKPRLAKAATDDGRMVNLVNQIKLLMEQEKLYQEPELTLQQLAEKLKVPAYQVSQAINEGMKKSFYDLINAYRVTEAKRLLQDTDSCNYTILSVGFEAGFNSKTTFNTVFKKFTGLTPSEFRSKEQMVFASA